MAHENKIRTAGREAEVRELAAQGLGYREIAAKLSESGFVVSRMCVSRFLKDETQERREAARSVAAQDAQESVPLVTKALTQLVKMNMTAAKRAYVGTGTETNPAPDIRDLAAASNAAISAAKALHSITVGEADQTSASDMLRSEVEAILAARSRFKDGESADDDEED